jgi:hypothetical protein
MWRLLDHLLLQRMLMPWRWIWRLELHLWSVALMVESKAMWHALCCQRICAACGRARISVVSSWGVIIVTLWPSMETTLHSVTPTWGWMKRGEQMFEIGIILCMYYCISSSHFFYGSILLTSSSRSAWYTCFVFQRSHISSNMAGGIRYADHVAPSIRKSWQSLRRQSAVARSV